MDKTKLAETIAGAVQPLFAKLIGPNDTTLAATDLAEATGTVVAALAFLLMDKLRTKLLPKPQNQ